MPCESLLWVAHLAVCETMPSVRPCLLWDPGFCEALPSVRPWLLWGFAFCETLPSVRNPDFVYLCLFYDALPSVRPCLCLVGETLSSVKPCLYVRFCLRWCVRPCHLLLFFWYVWWARPCPRPCHLKPIHLKMFWPSRSRRPLLSWFSFENHMWWICPQALYEPEPLTLQTRAGYHPSTLTEKFEPQFSQTVKFSNCHVFMSLVMLSYFLYFFHYLPLFLLISHVFSYF